MSAAITSVNQKLQDKLQNLVSYLFEVNMGFETIAEEIECTNLKTAMIALSVESKQYAEEISVQLQSFNIAKPSMSAESFWDRVESDMHKQANLYKGGEITALCNNCETYFKQFYEDVLKEYFPLKNFKDIITYQLFATQCAFMKIRLLNSLRFSNNDVVN